MNNSHTEFQEIISRLRELQEDSDGRGNKSNDKTPVIPLIDPTANVISLMAASNLRQDDLRNAEKEFQEKIRVIKQECDKEKDQLKEQLRIAESSRIDAVNLAERNRIDANVAQGKADVALASEKAAATAITLAGSVVASAKALSDTVANTTTIQDKRLTALEQNQYQGTGGTMQRAAGRQEMQWLIGIVMVLVLALINHFWH
jgi:hypothetical protein